MCLAHHLVHLWLSLNVLAEENRFWAEISWIYAEVSVIYHQIYSLYHVDFFLCSSFLSPQKVCIWSPLTTTQCQLFMPWIKIDSTFRRATIPAVRSFRKAVEVLDILCQMCSELNHLAEGDFGLCERSGRGPITPVHPFSWRLHSEQMARGMNWASSTY